MAQKWTHATHLSHAAEFREHHSTGWAFPHNHNDLSCLTLACGPTLWDSGRLTTLLVASNIFVVLFYIKNYNSLSMPEMIMKSL